tara:strand:+ start:2475 stop:3878 length:1404 start_codon:yes stop_codon:yes gene_type:complete
MDINKLNLKMDVLKNPNSNQFKIMISIVLVVIVLIYFYIKKKNSDYEKMNPRFLKVPKYAKDYDTIEGIKLQKSMSGYDFTYFMWIYVDNMAYKYRQWKHIVTKGHSGYNKAKCPGFWIDPIMNDIVVQIQTHKGLDEFKIKDFPLKKWFSVAIVVKNTELELYKNGNIEKFITLKSVPILNDGDLEINKYGGFDGYVSNIMYFPFPKSHLFIKLIHRNGVDGQNMFEKMYNYFFSDFKLPITVDLGLMKNLNKFKNNTIGNGRIYRIKERIVKLGPDTHKKPFSAAKNSDKTFEIRTYELRLNQNNKRYELFISMMKNGVEQNIPLHHFVQEKSKYMSLTNIDQYLTRNRYEKQKSINALGIQIALMFMKNDDVMRNQVHLWKNLYLPFEIKIIPDGKKHKLICELPPLKEIQMKDNYFKAMMSPAWYKGQKKSHLMYKQFVGNLQLNVKVDGKMLTLDQFIEKFR